MKPVTLAVHDDWVVIERGRLRHYVPASDVQSFYRTVDEGRLDIGFRVGSLPVTKIGPCVPFIQLGKFWISLAELARIKPAVMAVKP